MFQINESTVDLGSPKKLRQAETPHSQALEKIKVDLIKISSNATQSDYFGVRKIRSKFNSILQSDSSNLSRQDCVNRDEIKSLLAKLKRTHPELCSKEEYRKTQSFRDSQKQTTFDRTALEASQDVSRDVLSSFVARRVTIDLPPSQLLLTEGASQQTPITDSADIVQCTGYEAPPEDEAAAKTHQCTLWAIELQMELEKQQAREMREKQSKTFGRNARDV